MIAILQGEKLQMVILYFHKCNLHPDSETENKQHPRSPPHRTDERKKQERKIRMMIVTSVKEKKKTREKERSDGARVQLQPVACTSTGSHQARLAARGGSGHAFSSFRSGRPEWRRSRGSWNSTGPVSRTWTQRAGKSCGRRTAWPEPARLL